MRTSYLLGLAAAVSCSASLASAAIFPSEYWVSKDQGWAVETKQCGETLCGYLVSFKPERPQDPGFVQLDKHNSDPNRRTAPLCGLRVMGDFKPSEKPGAFEDGWLYDPDSGSTYSATISLVDQGTVKLRGFIGISLFGKTLVLHRTTAAPERCSLPPAGNAG